MIEIDENLINTFDYVLKTRETCNDINDYMRSQKIEKSENNIENLEENINVLVQDTDAISSKIEDLGMNSKVERQKIDEKLASLNLTIKELTDQVSSMSYVVNDTQSTGHTELLAWEDTNKFLRLQQMQNQGLKRGRIHHILREMNILKFQMFN